MIQASAITRNAAFTVHGPVAFVLTAAFDPKQTYGATSRQGYEMSPRYSVTHCRLLGCHDGDRELLQKFGDWNSVASEGRLHIGKIYLSLNGLGLWPGSAAVGKATEPSSDRNDSCIPPMSPRKGNDMIAISSLNFQRQVVSFRKQVEILLAQSEEFASPSKLHPAIRPLTD